ncbi:sulfatase-like hydrolase/transferase [Shewanella marina]|uniref:sulfatase-like hydrolase/transferase n=1 Tax=Shewanella marina TaxID=487319 RepID=UPI0004729891|nr:sulfatase-like hydrolase/transferase [Shewanella marina]
MKKHITYNLVLLSLIILLSVIYSHEQIFRVFEAGDLFSLNMINTSIGIALLHCGVIILLIIIFTSFLSSLVDAALSHLLNRNNHLVTLASILTVYSFFIIINSTLYPYSPTSISTKGNEYLLIVILLSISALILLGAHNTNKKILLVTILLIVFTPIDLLSKSDVINNKRNIILIGIDSLRFDHIAKSGNEAPLLQSIDAFIDNATLFNNAYTPAARTFVAWSSLLTGQEPIDNGIRFNLTNLNDINKDIFITKQLKENGYKTIWALDERRFSNIDESFHFDKAIGHTANAPEFMFTSLNALPIASLMLIHSNLKYIFDYIYLNRAAWWSYNPNTFIDEILNQLTTEKTFMAIHLTLPHWPYKSSKLELVNNNIVEDNFDYYAYLMMLNQVDQQFNYLMENLEKRGFLKNSLVILLSDHGESFQLNQDGPQALISSAEFKTNDYGHGTNVLSDAQFKTVLAIKDYSLVDDKPTVNTSLVSLTDVAPTILKWANLASESNVDLLAQTINRDNLFIESSFNPIKLTEGRVNQIQTINNSIYMYEVNNAGRLSIKKNLYKELIKGKQRAVINNELLLATFPDMSDELILVDRDNYTWQPASTYEDKTVVANLFHILCSHFKLDVESGLFSQCEEPNQFLDNIYQKWN